MAQQKDNKQNRNTQPDQNRQQQSQKNTQAPNRNAAQQNMTDDTTKRGVRDDK